MHVKGIVMFAGLALMVSPAAAAEPSGKVRPRAPETTYCFQLATDTGSRISRTECKTKKEWARLGVDVDELLRK